MSTNAKYLDNHYGFVGCVAQLHHLRGRCKNNKAWLYYVQIDDTLVSQPVVNFHVVADLNVNYSVCWDEKAMTDASSALIPALGMYTFCSKLSECMSLGGQNVEAVYGEPTKMTANLVIGSGDASRTITLVLSREPTPSTVHFDIDNIKSILWQEEAKHENVLHMMRMCSVSRSFQEQAATNLNKSDWVKNTAYLAAGETFVSTVPNLCENSKWTEIADGLYTFSSIVTVHTRTCTTLLHFLQHQKITDVSKKTRKIIFQLLENTKEYTTQCKELARRVQRQPTQTEKITMRVNAQVASCKLLLQITQGSAYYPLRMSVLRAAFANVISPLMREHPMSVEVQTQCCQILCTDVVTQMDTEACIPLLLAAMRAHAANVHVCKAVCLVLMTTEFRPQYEKYKNAAMHLVIAAVRELPALAGVGCVLLRRWCQGGDVGHMLVFKAGGMQLAHDIICRGRDENSHEFTQVALRLMIDIITHIPEANISVAVSLPMITAALHDEANVPHDPSELQGLLVHMLSAWLPQYEQNK